MHKKKKIIPLILIFIGLALLLGALFFWIDTLTSAEPAKLSESIRDWLTLLLGLGASLKGWMDLFKPEKPSPATEIKVTGGSPQITTSENGRTIQAQTYIEKQVIQGQEVPSSRDYLHQLPSPPADFTGRADEIEQLLAALSDGKRAAISGLSGMGGVGKTALGLIAAQRLCGEFSEAQIFLDLKGTTDPLPPAEAMRRVLLSFFPTADLRALDDAQFAAAYRDALHGKKALLFLDNARAAAQVKPLLPPDSCCLLVTSRWHFTLPGLNPLRLDVLKPKEAQDFLLELCPRLGAAAPELAARCGCLPMALRIAASFLACNENWTPAEYLQRLAEGRKRLEALKSPDDPDLNVAAAFRLSYLCLPDADRKCWRTLGVFPAPFNLQAAQALWELSEDPARELLTTLHNYSLLDILPSPLEGGVRYRLHDLLADYAHQEMMSEEVDEARLRHAEYFFTILGNANDLFLKGGENILAGLSLFDSESVHIYTAQKWAAENAARGERMAELAMLYPDAGTYCLDLRLTPKHQIEWLSSALTAARALSRKDMEGNHLGNLGLAYFVLGDTRRAIEFCEQCLTLHREIGNWRDEGADLGNLGNACAALGDARRAIEFYEQALAVMQEIGDKHAEGSILGNLGLAYADQGDARRAIEFHKQALAVMQEIGDKRAEGSILGNLGLAYADQGDARWAIEYYEQRLVIAREIGDRGGEGTALGNMGNAYAALGDARRAIEFYEQALVIAREIGDKRNEGAWLGNLGNALYGLGEKERGLVLIKQALAIYEAIESPHAGWARDKLKEWGA
jgi:tetratricopeptide (TPR) repeat protein